MPRAAVDDNKRMNLRLAPAARRCLRAAAEVGGVVLLIDAKNARAAHS